MINFEEELKKFKPSLEIDQAEEAILQERSPGCNGHPGGYDEGS
ncbi:MAG: hypothetical protein ACLR1V_00430 [Coprococcus sp.]